MESCRTLKQLVAASKHHRNITGSSAIIASNLGEGPAIMTVLPTDVAVEVGDCGNWTRVP